MIKPAGWFQKVEKREDRVAMVQGGGEEEGCWKISFFFFSFFFFQKSFFALTFQAPITMITIIVMSDHLHLRDSFQREQ